MGVQLCNPPLTSFNHYPPPQVLTRGPNLDLTLDFGLSLGHVSTLGVGGEGLWLPPVKGGEQNCTQCMGVSKVALVKIGYS